MSNKTSQCILEKNLSKISVLLWVKRLTNLVDLRNFFLMWEKDKPESSIISMQCRAKQPTLLKDCCQKTDFPLC